MAVGKAEEVRPSSSAEGIQGMAAAEARGWAWPADVGRWLAPLISFLLILLGWQLLVTVGGVQAFIVPPPAAVYGALADQFPSLMRHTGVTLGETLLGFFLSIVVAVPLAVVISASPPLRNGIYPLLLLGQSVPKQALAPLLLLWIGYRGLGGEQEVKFTAVALSFLTAFFPIVVNTAVGLQMTPPEMLDLGRLLAASRWRVFTKVTFPSAMPYFFAGLKVAISLAVVGAVIGEFIGADHGLGHLILISTANVRTPLAFAAIGMLSLLGIILFALVSLAERIVCPWYGKG
jgi:NitT/TauT family transport system permease protein